MCNENKTIQIPVERSIEVNAEKSKNVYNVEKGNILL